MTKDPGKAAAPVEPAPSAPAPKTATDLIEAPGAELTGGGKSPTLAADAAANLTAASTGAPEAPKGDPTPPAPGIGRSSVRAGAGFHRKLTKPQLIERGRKLAEEKAELERRLAALTGEPSPDGTGEPATAVVAIDPKQMEEPLAEMAGVVSDFLAAWRGEHWEFTAEERTKLGKAAAPVFVELAPALGAHASKLTLVIVALSLALPRLRKDRELKAASTPAPAA